MITNYIVYKEKKLIDYLNDFYLSKSKIYTLFLEKRIKVNNSDCNRNTLLKTNDIVTIDSFEEIDFIPDNKKLDILYEDDYLLIVNKPSNIIVHPDSKDKNGSLCNIVANYYKNKGYDCSIKYAHRLDIDTTGIIVFCKDMLSMSYMNHLISLHLVKRYYLALAQGIFKNKEGIIENPIGEDRHHKSRRRVSKTGQTAITHYKVVQEFNNYSLVELLLETGRTHQIRVHLSYIGHPIMGDELYGGNKKLINRVALHSHRIEFIHPVTKRVVSITKKLPFDMCKLV